MTINFVLGAHLEGDELTFWFEDTQIKTCYVLRVGDKYTLEREA